MMKNFYSKLLLAALTLCTTVAFAQNDLIFTGVMDGPLSGGTPKALEIYVANDVADMSMYGIAKAGNGDMSPGVASFTFPNVAVTAGTYIYVSSVNDEFVTYFGFAPDYVANSELSVNGDDAIELYYNGVVYDELGLVGEDGTGKVWEYLDGWMYRINGSNPSSPFITTDWIYSGINATDNETSNATAATPWPIGTYSLDPPVAVEVTIAEIQETTDLDGNSPLVGQLVITSGIVTGFYNSGFWMQDGSGAWTGIFVRTDDAPVVVIGDSLTVNATVQESNGLTRLNSVTNITLNSAGNLLPAPVLVTTGAAGVEDYESVLIAINTATCIDADLGFGEWAINDGSGDYTVDDVMYDAMPVNFVNYDLTGIATYSFGNFKMLPRDADDVVVGDAEVGLTFENAEMMVSETEGTVTVNVSIANPTDVATTVDVVVNGGTATNGTHYTFTDPTTLTFPAFSTDMQSFTFDVTDDVISNDDRTIIFGLQNANNDAVFGTSELEVTITDDDTEVVITDIAVAAAVDVDGVALNIGTEYTVGGVIHGGNFNAAGLSFTIIDPTGGMGVYSGTPVSEYTVTEGDSVLVTGVVSQFNGLTQLNPTSIELISQGNDLMEPVIVTAFSENLESSLVKLECVYIVDPGQWTNGGSGFNVTVANAEGAEFALRIDNDVDLYSAAAPTGTFDVTGLIGQFDNQSPFLSGYQMYPRYVADIVAAECDITLAPANDNCAGAADVNDLLGGAIGEAQVSTMYSNELAGIENDPAFGYECFGEPDGGGSAPSIEHTVWFKFVGDGNTYLIETNDCNGTATDYIDDGDTQMAIYSGICSIIQAVDCNEDGPSATATEYPAGAELATEMGQTYLVMIDGYLGAQGEFCLSFTRMPLANDECDGAVDISDILDGALNAPVESGMYSNVGATTSVDEPNPNDVVANCWVGEPTMSQTVWFSFTGDGATYLFETTNCSGTATNYITDGDTQMAIFTGSCGEYTQVACNEDGPNATSTDFAAGIELATENGVEYLVMIDGYEGVEGEFCMQATMTVPNGLENINAFTFDLYPNPTKDRLFVQAPISIEAATLTNIIGQEVKAFSFIASQNLELNVKGLDAGLYILQLRSSENRISTAKVIVE